MIAVYTTISASQLPDNLDRIETGRTAHSAWRRRQEHEDYFHRTGHHNFTQMESHFGKNMWITMQDLKLAIQGVAARLRPSLIDEIPGAYKDIDVALENSRELVKIQHTLKQIVNVKRD